MEALLSTMFKSIQGFPTWAIEGLIFQKILFSRHDWCFKLKTEWGRKPRNSFLAQDKRSVNTYVIIRHWNPQTNFSLNLLISTQNCFCKLQVIVFAKRGRLLWSNNASARKPTFIYFLLFASQLYIIRSSCANSTCSNLKAAHISCALSFSFYEDQLSFAILSLFEMQRILECWKQHFKNAKAFVSSFQSSNLHKCIVWRAFSICCSMLLEI